MPNFAVTGMGFDTSNLVFRLSLFSATRFILLDRRAFHRAVRAKHTAISVDWFEQGSARFTVVKKLAGIGRHDFCFGVPAVRARDRRVQNNPIHFPFPWTVDGKPANVVASVNLSAVTLASSNSTVAVLLA